jgi:diguanylate cyclase (GGDEF)-like protein
MSGRSNRHDKDDEEDTGRIAPQPFGDERAGPEPRQPYLVALTGGQMGQLFALDADEVTIGRGTACEVRIADDGVSRRHSRIVRKKGTHWLEDLESRNGTFLNGQRLSALRALAEGDRIQIGTGTVVKFALIDYFEAAFQQRMFEAAVRDALTAVYNRRHLIERLETELAFAKRHSTPLAMLLIDIDDLKTINREHGHVVGDKFLRALARRLRSIVRTEDLLARYGGGDFAILSRIGLRGAKVFAERIRALVANKEFAADSVTRTLTVSLGVVVFPDVGVESSKKLLEALERAVSAAKKGGRNRVAIGAGK